MKKLIIIFILGILFLSGCNNCENENLDCFAKCLTEEGFVIYTLPTCGHCKQQKELFGESFQYLNHVDCYENSQYCVDKGVRYVPTWEIYGELIDGLLTLEELSEKSGCDLPQ